MIALRLVLVICAALSVACSTAVPEPPQAFRPLNGDGPTISIWPGCVDLADEVGRLATGDTTTDAVRMAADELSDAVADARTAAWPEIRVHLDEAAQALRRMRETLSTRPVDAAELRDATTDLATALRDTATGCDPTSNITVAPIAPTS